MFGFLPASICASIYSAQKQKGVIMATELHPSESVKLLEKRIKALEKHVFSRAFNPEAKKEPKAKSKKATK